MNHKTFLPLLLGLFLLTGCREEIQLSDGSIDLRKALARQEPLKASDYFSRVEYLPLEITEEAIIGGGPEVQLIGDHLLITTAQKQALLFDRKTGKFIKEVGHYGNDPEAYSKSYGWVNNSNKKIYFPGWAEDLMVFDQDGEFDRVIKVPLGDTSGNVMMAYSYLDGDTLIGYYNDIFGDSRERVILFDGEGYTQVIPSTGYSPVIRPDEITGIDVNGGDEAVKVYGPTANKGVLRFLTGEEEMGGFMFIGNIFFWQDGTSTCFKEPFNDTIYTVSAAGLAPRRVLELGEDKWSMVDKYDKTKEKAPFFTHFMESRDYLFMRYIRRIYTDPQIYNLVYNKTDGSAKSDKYGNGFVDDLTHFLPLQPLYLAPSGEFMGILSPEEIREWFEKNRTKTDRLPEEVKQLEHLPFDANPVIVIFH